jgi:DNA primase large subunit
MQAVRHEELKTIIKESVKEALEEELSKIRLMFFPEVSDKEMLDIINRYEKPVKKSVYTENIDI